MQTEDIVTEYETEVFYYSSVGRHRERCQNIRCVFIQHQNAILLQVCPQMIQKVIPSDVISAAITNDVCCTAKHNSLELK